MKRSEINAEIRYAESLAKKYQFNLPPFASWTPEEWAHKGHEYDEIRDNALGWDVTDFGIGQFQKYGLTLFTIRNGNQKLAEKYPKVYCEKIFIIKPGQILPFHYHKFKTEDIICRNGGKLLAHLYNVGKDGKLADTDVTVKRDGRSYTVKAGEDIIYGPGESVTLMQYTYHEVMVVPGTDAVLVGEVSRCNDDVTDNFFLEMPGRFPKIEEDEKPYHLLCNEYPAAK